MGDGEGVVGVFGEEVGGGAEGLGESLRLRMGGGRSGW